MTISDEKTALGYTRLSQESDTSIERQARHIRVYADNKNFDLELIYDDGERSSGWDDGREAFGNLHEHIKKDRIDAVIVNDVRRLSRDFDESMRLILDFRKYDVELHTWQQGQIDLSDPVNAAIEVVKAGVSHEAKQAEIERSREAVEERIEKGHWQGRPMYGMTMDDDGKYLVPADDDDWEAALEVLELRDSGRTYAEIEGQTGVTARTAATSYSIVNATRKHSRAQGSAVTA